MPSSPCSNTGCGADLDDGWGKQGDSWQVPAVESHSGKSTGLPDYSDWEVLAYFLYPMFLLFFLPDAVEEGSGTGCGAS
jgi:hypothetical protein